MVVVSTSVVGTSSKVAVVSTNVVGDDNCSFLVFKGSEGGS